MPSQSHGRTVGEQLAHLDRVRRAWLWYHETGQRPKFEKTQKGAPPPMKELRVRLAESGEEAEQHLAKAMRGEARIRMFGGNAVLWMSYLISHESHHRGQITLALKQNGLRLPEAVAMKDLWGRWMMAR